jgi:hypothetical protein
MRPAPSTAFNAAPLQAQPLQQVQQQAGAGGEAKAKAAALTAQQRAQRVPNYALLARGEER